VPTVVDLVVDGLLAAGVSRLFSVERGGPVVEAVEAAARARSLPVVRCHDAGAAVTMAAATGEVTGRPGAACSGAGAGVTASATGLAHALADRCPLIYLSARHAGATPASGARPVVDHAAHLGPIVKASVALGADSVSHWVAHAAQLALAEPRGPVHLDLPADVVSEAALPLAVSPRPRPAPPPDAARLDQAAAMIRAARRPLVLAGLECRPGDARWLRAFCEAVPAPALTTLKAKGAVPGPHPLAMGEFTGGAPEAPVLSRADLIVAFGLDAVELGARPWPYTAAVLRLARSPWSEPGARGGGFFTPALDVVGDLALILEELAPRLVGGDGRADWDVAEVDRLRRARRSAVEVPSARLAPHRVAQLCRALTPAGAIACIDPGEHAAVAAACWDAVEPGECLVSSGLALPGFALPAAIAARLAHPDRPVLCLTDVPGLLSAVPAMRTAVDLRLPVTVVVFDGRPVPDAAGSSEVRASAAREPDLPRLCLALGLPAFSAADETGFERALVQALGARAPSAIDARVDPAAYGRAPGLGAIG
jgi:acetolactate synthase-1/2/3 large subunit